ncbi:polysaccharide biosynthesis tyrosine autokinase [Gordonia alkanivorans]|uniref:polysaccharide biosynthesis tyrosine autokinase n=1 Tax=Gordonia alkanivorans TaxID=84096 RepID=UPI00244D0AEA|nr:polysaccharide biosynthesis tyrosine autokinase [Gordonia alkanivorans]MDH3046688.1 polysaccharide biosynthesis tyrosine autokinase [Gordonia alkanivorans]MDJ0010340.1 polysaccharide biosynthesis tyrosine autokinase [Gordonia alkanivorans]MDJ0100113.1 polysaccharide biosynthesis tyrosine autokinase [Gordonia alkanivorans]MDJ0495978.1 polysaccharide biosynthesis tyrosine autokinase [Gordonia alkanivorans]
MTEHLTEADAGNPRRRPVADVLSVVRRNWWILLCSALLVGVIGLAFSVVQSSEYRSSATLYVTSGSDPNTQSAYQGSQAAQQRVASYVKLVTSDAIVMEALRDGSINLSMDEARERLTASAAPDTVLVTIGATDTDPERARALATAVAEAMTRYIETLEQPSGGGDSLAKLTVVSFASPAEKVAPRVLRNAGLSVLLGFFLGMLIVYLRERFDTVVRTAANVPSVVGSPVLASVPQEPMLRGGGTINFAAGATSGAAESYRRLRTNLAFSNVDKPPRVVLVASACPGEGKTTTALNLAASLADSGDRVVIVDGDLRRPEVAKRTGRQPAVGLTNYLRGDAKMEDLVQASDFPNLDVLTSGELPPNPAELLASDRAAAGIRELAGSYDYVVVDSPPILPVTDAAVTARSVDGVLLVVRAGSTKQPDLVDAVEMLRAANVSILGLIMNDVQSGNAGYRYSGYASTEEIAAVVKPTSSPATSATSPPVLAGGKQGEPSLGSALNSTGSGR